MKRFLSRRRKLNKTTVVLYDFLSVLCVPSPFTDAFLQTTSNGLLLREEFPEVDPLRASQHVDDRGLVLADVLRQSDGRVFPDERPRVLNAVHVRAVADPEPVVEAFAMRLERGADLPDAVVVHELLRRLAGVARCAILLKNERRLWNDGCSC